MRSRSYPHLVCKIVIRLSWKYCYGFGYLRTNIGNWLVDICINCCAVLIGKPHPIFRVDAKWLHAVWKCRSNIGSDISYIVYMKSCTKQWHCHQNRWVIYQHWCHSFKIAHLHAVWNFTTITHIFRCSQNNVTSTKKLKLYYCNENKF